MKIDYYENTGVAKYLEDLAVSKYFAKSDSELVGNDIIDYCRRSRLRIGRYERMKSALKAIERTEGSYEYYIQDFKSFREMVNFYID